MPFPLMVMFGVFFTLMGGCVGSFLNVVIWRLPNRGREVMYLGKKRILTLSWPPSHCPMCDAPIPWYLNLPILSYIALRGRCANCKASIPIRYPLVELATAMLWLGFYLAYYVALCQKTTYPWQAGTLPPGAHIGMGITDFRVDWAPMVFHAVLASTLLAASAIDADLFIIPMAITWLLAILGIVGSVVIGPPFFDKTYAIIPGLNAATIWLGKPIIGAVAGLIISNVLLWTKILPRSFPWEFDPPPEPAEPENEVKEGKPEPKEEQMAPPPKLTRFGPSVVAAILIVAAVAALWWLVSPNAAAIAGVSGAILVFLIGVLPRDAGQFDDTDTVVDEISMGNIRFEMSKEILFLAIPIICAYIAHVLPGELPTWPWLSRLLGSLLGMLAGGGAVWLFRVGGSIGFNKQAMGIGDVHLMAGVGAIIGAPLVIIAFFVAAFVGLLWAVVLLVMRKSNVLPYGPWLSVGAILTLFIGNQLLRLLFPVVP